MHVSAAGIALIKKWEGCVLQTYRCPAGVLTIGYGCTGPEARPGRTITQAEAERLLAGRLAHEFVPGVSAAIGDAPTTQAQFDAMVSLAFNIGVGKPGGKGGFVNSSICRLHRERNYLGAADAFGLYVMSGGRYLEPLHRRRLEEEKLYLSDLPQATPSPQQTRTSPQYTRTDCARDMQKAVVSRGVV
jgi:lysozyme